MADLKKQKQAEEEIERYRKEGLAMTGGQMDKAHQDALKALMGRQQPQPSPLEEEEKRRSKILGAAKSITK